MDFWMLFLTICLVCATIYVQKWLRNGKNSFTRAWFQLRHCGGRVSVGPWNKTRYCKGLNELWKAMDAFPDDCGSMQISKEQCRLLRWECRRLVKPIQPDSILLKESFCAVRRIVKLMEDCCAENWLLKAVEFGNCQEHFLEILLDLHRLPILVKLIGFGGESFDEMDSEFRSINICENVKKKIDDAWKFDKTDLRRKVDEIRDGCPDHYLADQLRENPSLLPPPEIGRYVTEFDFLKTPCIYRGGGDMFVFPVTFCNKEFVVKMRYSKCVAEVLEDSQDVTLKNEAKVMKECRHPYAVGLFGYWEFTRTAGPKVPLLLMESMECDLKELIKRNKRNKRWWWGGTGGFPALDAISLVLPVAKVMRYLHSIEVVHRDLKPENILFTRVPGTQHLPEDVSVKLADFGSAGKVKDVAGIAGTTGYMDPDVKDREKMDPDVKDREKIVNYKADVFSFGMVFGEVLTGLSPPEALDCMFDSDDGSYVASKKFYEILKQGRRPRLPKETPNFLKSIVESCWAPKPEARPSFEDICWMLQNTEFLLLNSTC